MKLMFRQQMQFQKQQAEQLARFQKQQTEQQAAFQKQMLQFMKQS